MPRRLKYIRIEQYVLKSAHALCITSREYTYDNGALLYVSLKFSVCWMKLTKCFTLWKIGKFYVAIW